MTLPSTKRPREVEEEIRAVRLALDKDVCPKLVLRTSKVEIFKKTMEDWYTTELTDKERRRLSGKELKRKAVNVCYLNDMLYDALPNNWLSELEKKCGLKLYVKRNANVDRTDSKMVSSSNDLISSKVLSTPGIPSGIAGSKKKVFVDHSMISPPPMWLEAFAKGEVLPRVLSIISTDDANVLFYDYNPKLKDSFGRRIKMMPKPREPADLKSVFGLKGQF